MKRKHRILAAAVMLALLVCMSTPVDASVHSFKLNKKSVTVEEGDTFTLKVSGTAAKVGKTKWKTSKKSVVKIKSVQDGSDGLNKGYKVKLKAVKAGKATITVTNSKTSDTLACKVIVKEGKLKAPVITSAVSTGTTKAGKVKIAWNAVDRASKYQIQISTEEDFSDLLRVKVTEKTSYNTGWNFYNYVGSGIKKVYYCRVKSIGADGKESTWTKETCEQE